MKQNDDALLEVARALLAGMPIDWASAESNAVDDSVRAIVRQMKVIAEIADVHGTRSLSDGLHTETVTSTAGPRSRRRAPGFVADAADVGHPPSPGEGG